MTKNKVVKVLAVCAVPACHERPTYLFTLLSKPWGKRGYCDEHTEQARSLEEYRLVSIEPWPES